MVSQCTHATDRQVSTAVTNAAEFCAYSNDQTLQAYQILYTTAYNEYVMTRYEYSTKHHPVHMRKLTHSGYSNGISTAYTGVCVRALLSEVKDRPPALVLTRSLAKPTAHQADKTPLTLTVNQRQRV